MTCRAHPRAGAAPKNSDSVDILAVRAIRRPPVERRRHHMLYLVVSWFLSALSLVVVAHIVPGFQVSSFGSALIAAIVIGLINSTLGVLLKILTFPLTLVTFGLFIFVINALMLRFASAVVEGFHVDGFGPALIGAIVLAIVSTVLHNLVFG
jgi:putative membrane protein